MDLASSFTPSASLVCKYKLPSHPRFTSPCMRNVYPAGFGTNRNRANAPVEVNIDTSPPTAFQYSQNLFYPAKRSNIAWMTGYCMEQLEECGGDSLDPFADVAGNFMRGEPRRLADVALNRNASKIVDLVLLQNYEDSSQTPQKIPKEASQPERSRPRDFNRFHLANPDWTFEEWMCQRKDAARGSVLKQNKRDGVPRVKKTMRRCRSEKIRLQPIATATTTTLAVDKKQAYNGSSVLVKAVACDDNDHGGENARDDETVASTMTLVPRQLDSVIDVELYRCAEVLMTTTPTLLRARFQVRTDLTYTALCSVIDDFESQDNCLDSRGQRKAPSVFYFHPTKSCWRPMTSQDEWLMALFATLEISTSDDPAPLRLMYSYESRKDTSSDHVRSTDNSGEGQSLRISPRGIAYSNISGTREEEREAARIRGFVERLSLSETRGTDTEAGMTFRLRTPTGGWSLDPVAATPLGVAGPTSGRYTPLNHSNVGSSRASHHPPPTHSAVVVHHASSVGGSVASQSIGTGTHGTIDPPHLPSPPPQSPAPGNLIGRVPSTFSESAMFNDSISDTSRNASRGGGGGGGGGGSHEDNSFPTPGRRRRVWRNPASITKSASRLSIVSTLQAPRYEVALSRPLLPAKQDKQELMASQLEQRLLRTRW